MTYSIVAFDRATGAFGVAVATCHLAVGALAPHARAGVGALASQGSVPNYRYVTEGLRRLARGLPAEHIVAALTAEDAGRGHRQLCLVDRRGAVAAWTGADSVPWAGHRCAEGFVVAGNMLAGPAVLDAMAAAYAAGAAEDLHWRLFAALAAGEAAGGDKRGRQSAALLVVEREDYPLHDYRVDHGREPLAALREILEESEKDYFRRFRATLPTRADPHRH